MAKPVILVSNDDGPASRGLHALVRALLDVGDVVPVVPEGPRSGTSMSLTFHKPLRIREVQIAGEKGYVVSGSPADAVMMALNKVLLKKPDAMASGINIGDNSGLQDVYSSGTVSAALQAALSGIPSVAFSMQMPESTVFSPSDAKADFGIAGFHARKVMHWLVKNGLPEGVNLLNVNVPANATYSTKAVFSRLALHKYDNYIVERMDPRGKPYYWVWGNRLAKYEEGSDAKAIIEDGLVSVTPIHMDPTWSTKGMEGLLEALNG
ncbi:MAG TPA: 5'/3'-nucleotidase SurE [Conexivisphaerales archaeon]|nr:5'/3'-nucleotidase SurE [Conexivisphaerales archaeon]